MLSNILLTAGLIISVIALGFLAVAVVTKSFEKAIQALAKVTAIAIIMLIFIAFCGLFYGVLWLLSVIWLPLVYIALAALVVGTLYASFYEDHHDHRKTAKSTALFLVTIGALIFVWWLIARIWS